VAKYIFVTGGVVSSLGKGIASASIGALLESRGLKVTIQKLDPYINVDPGTMSPFQHGEVFVTDDGAETDLDLGHYERFTGIRTSQKNNFTSGRVYYNVITKERRGDYLGGTVQMVPHITDEIKRNIRAVEDEIDIVIVEVGGTVGDIESLPFLEAIRQFRFDIGRENVLYIHLTLLPYIEASGEIKTKPTQHSVNKLREIGIQPNILLCRTDRFLSKEVKRKIALFCNVEEEAVITAKNVDTIYEVPLLLHEEGLDDQIVSMLKLETKEPDLRRWRTVVERIKNPETTVSIALVGKYINLKDSYKSLIEALTHGGIANRARVDISWVDAEAIEKDDADRYLSSVDGILVPGGFGIRGIEGKIKAIMYAREKKVPFLGICLGMQCAVIEFARNVCNLKGAHSTEFDRETPYPVIYLMERWYDYRLKVFHERTPESEKGGTMRLGAYPCILKEGSFAYKAYGTRQISERHRHRYEFNNRYRDPLVEGGMRISGESPDGELVEIIEIENHPWFLGCQFHPEFKSRPMEPHPIFRDFIAAAIRERKLLFPNLPGTEFVSKKQEVEDGKW